MLIANEVLTAVEIARIVLRRDRHSLPLRLTNVTRGLFRNVKNVPHFKQHGWFYAKVVGTISPDNKKVSSRHRHSHARKVPPHKRFFVQDLVQDAAHPSCDSPDTFSRRFALGASDVCLVVGEEK